MPIKDICSCCGGRGTVEFLSLTKPHWRTKTCPDCRGEGKPGVLSFQERKDRDRAGSGHDPDSEGAEESQP